MATAMPEESLLPKAADVPRGKEVKMRKREIEKLLVQAVAEALGVADDATGKARRIAAPQIDKPATGSHHDRAAA